jgi:cyclopropane fatty-acyl-phospholipid synthase-like methyltransferase
VVSGFVTTWQSKIAADCSLHCRSLCSQLVAFSEKVHRQRFRCPRTLNDWRTNFRQAWPVSRTMGFDERFRRIWDYHLAYCRPGFEARVIDVGLSKIIYASGQSHNDTPMP